MKPRRDLAWMLILALALLALTMPLWSLQP